MNEVHKPVVRQRGYFIAGKFDQFKRNIPYASLIQAFQELIRQLLTESDEKIAVWKSKFSNAFGPNGQVIIDVIPDVELIVGKQSPVPQLGPTEAQNRFLLVLKQFIYVFTNKEHPLVLFLDDLQWADPASLNLIQLLMSDSDSQYLLMIGAYRDNEVDAAHPLMLTLDEMYSYGVRMNTITLRPLEITHVNQLITDTLGYESKRTEPFSELVLNKTQGNPFFLTQLLKSLYQDKLLTFDFQQGCWQWNVEQIQGMELTDNVVELMASRIQKLAEPTQQVLKLAACIGNQFDLDVLAVVSEKSTVATASDLWPALQVGLILPLGGSAYKIPQVLDHFDELVSYKFLHDRVQQAAYTLIPEADKKLVHLCVGRLILGNTSPEELEEKVFDIVNHLNMSAELITSLEERVELAKLNLTAGKKAKVSTAYASALNYNTFGIKLLPENNWEYYYSLSFCLHKEYAECEYLCSNFAVANQIFESLLTRAKTTLEIADIYSSEMLVYSSSNDFTGSIQLGMKGLNLFGIDVPETEEKLQTAIEAELREVQSNLNNREIADLIHLPQISLLDKKVCMSFLMNLELPAHQTNPTLLSWITLKMVSLSLTYGNTDLSSLAYVMYGAILGLELGDYQSAYKFGKLALKLNEKFNVLALTSKINTIFSDSIICWLQYIELSFPFLKKAYQAGLESGDFLYAGFAFAQQICVQIIKGDDLIGVHEEAKKAKNFYQKTKNFTLLASAIIWQHFCLNLQGLTQDKYILSNETLNEHQHLGKLQNSGSNFGLNWYYLIKLQTLFIFESYDSAMKMAKAMEEITFIPGHILIAEYCFYYSLNITALYSNAGAEEKNQYWLTLEKNQVRMKNWADNCPENFLHKYLLVAAEMARLSGQELEAMKLYDQAIKSAQLNEYTQNAAIGNELAAKFYLIRGFDTIAKAYITEAYYGYAKWGATAKVKDLESKYPQLLSSTLARGITGIKPTRTTNSKTAGDSRSLDLTTVIKASMALSGEINLGKLLERLMKIVLENAGAQTGFFIAKQEDKLVIEAKAAVSKGFVKVLHSIPIEASHDLPVSLINYVERTKESLVLDNAKCEEKFAADPYIVANQPSSILCSPIIHQGKLTGIIYLENNLTTAAFTSERLEVLKLLTSQVSISIENARLYTNLQTYSQELEAKNISSQQSEARSRSQALQLEKALRNLQQTQTQLVQTEKMSSLGQLVTGIAHEINNPVNFIHGNLTHVTNYSQDLLALIKLYQHRYPNTDPEIQVLAEDIDLDFLIEDFPKILSAMEVGTDRIREIVLTLRNFSRLDEGEKKPVDIHQGIDSTLLILQHRLKFKPKHCTIEIVKEYGDLPAVECYAGLLNQVFMNILSNAIDALEEKLGNGDNPSIWIRTQVLDGNHVTIRIADNGPGMTPEVQQRLFDLFFTTKPVGKGTGLGLSISYQIIVEKHGGRLTCFSDPGVGTEFLISIPI